ncbi:replication protein [Spartinivicinus ruber]|uniref:replication protein n=1 Tax=Spartinivicinus ruber TaxID=2683272 RepID=UPI0013D5908B|nr:replication protein [Spartinivicinus ruber]
MDDVYDNCNGYVRLNNQLLEAICQLDISGRQFRILMAVIRKTIGYNIEVDWISASQLADLMAYDGATTHLHADLRILKERKIVITRGRKIGINKSLANWCFSKIETNQKPSLNKPKSVTHKETKNGQVSDRNPSVNKPNSVTPKQTENGQCSDRNRSEKVTENGHHKRQKDTKPKNTITPFNPPLEETNPQPSKKSKRRTPAKRTTTAPEHFPMTPELIRWASENFIRVDLIIETEKFLDHHRAKGSTFTCWASAWRNWMRNAQRFAAEKAMPPVPTTGPVKPNGIKPGGMDWDDTSWRHDLGL